jgi:hypothetical protein
LPIYDYGTDLSTTSFPAQVQRIAFGNPRYNLVELLYAMKSLGWWLPRYSLQQYPRIHKVSCQNGAKPAKIQLVDRSSHNLLPNSSWGAFSNPYFFFGTMNSLVWWLPRYDLLKYQWINTDSCQNGAKPAKIQLVESPSKSSWRALGNPYFCFWDYEKPWLLAA